MPVHNLGYANPVGVNMEDFVLSMGSYDEVPGKLGAWNNAMLAEDLKPFRRAADAIEASDLGYMIVRPAWMPDEDEVDYELTTRHAPFKGTVVSRKSVANLIASIIVATDGNKPYCWPAPATAARRWGEIAFAIGQLAKRGFSQIHP